MQQLKYVVFFIIIMIAFCVVSIQEFVFAEDDIPLYEYYQEMVGDPIQDVFEMKNLNGEKKFYLGVTTNNKYGVLYKETLELLEYSQFEEGIIFQEDLIYAGPGSILKETNGKYINCLNNDEFYFSEEEKITNSQYIDQLFYNSKKIKNSSIKNKIGEYNVGSNNGSQVNIPPEELFNKKLIHNYNYFLSNPMHGYNRYKECTYVAIQLLLSYNNYVVDRRIIDSQYTYSNINNPYDQATMYLGTNDQYFRKIISVINEIDDCAEFPCEHIKTASLEEQSQIVRTLLNERGQIDYTLNNYQHQNVASLSVDIIKNEIDSNRPLIVNISPLLGWNSSSGHSVVAYGYGNYSDGNDDNFGYITHFGWARANEESMYVNNFISAWINSNWVYQAITLDIKHNHNLVEANDNSNIMTCSSCGYNSVGFTYDESDLYVNITGTINDLGLDSSIEDFYGCLNIPTYINGKTVVQIENNAFDGLNITGVSIPSSVSTIKSQAFANCTNLEKVNLFSESEIYSIDNMIQINSESLLYHLEGFDNFTSSYRINLEYKDFSSTGDGTFSIGIVEVSGDCVIELVEPKQVSSESGILSFDFTLLDSNASLKNVCFKLVQSNSNMITNIYFGDLLVREGVIDIYSSAFENCINLTSALLDYTIENGAIVVKKGNFNESVLFIPKNVYINSELGSYPIKVIGDFSNLEKIRWVFTQSGLERIDNNAFRYCKNLKLVDLSHTSVYEIGDYAFDLCRGRNDNLHKHNLDSSLINICRLSSIKYPTNGSLKNIGEGAFICGGTPDNLPTSVESIGDYAFAYVKHISIFRMPNALKTIGVGAFMESNQIIVQNWGALSNLHTINGYAFYNTKTTNIDYLPKSVEYIGDKAFAYSLLSNNFYIQPGSLLYRIGEQAFYGLDIKSLVLSNTITTIGPSAFGGCSKLTIYTSFSSKPSNWINHWNSSNRPVVWGCNLSADRSYVVSVNKTSSTISNINASEGITKPYREGYNFGGWYTSTSFDGNQYTDISSAPNGTLYAKWTEKSSSGGCVTEGTMITLSDGTQTAVENLSGSEDLLVWDIYTGSYASAPILFIDSEELGLYNVIELTFNDGAILKIVSEHALWDVTTNKYEFIRENNASFYLGHYFNKGDCIVQLINIEIYEEITKIYSPVTVGHLCYYVNGLLSMPGNTESFINIFEVDANTMTINNESMLQDIAIYGLYTYDEFNNIVEVPEYIFNAFNGQYLKIALGKEITSFETLEELINMYRLKL